MILVVEGSNKVGKSSFIKYLKENFEKYSGKKVIVYRNRFSQNVLNHFAENTKERNYILMLGELNAVLSLSKQLDDTIIIFDRFHLSELVYGLYYRNYISFDMAKIDEQLAEEGAKLILFVSNYDHIDSCSIVDEFRTLQENLVRNYFDSKMDKCIMAYSPEKEHELMKEVSKFLEV